MILIKTIINNVEYNTESDENIIHFLSGTLYKKDDQYYLYCKREVLNGKICRGSTLFESVFPSNKEFSESLVPNLDDKDRAVILGLGDGKFIKREVTEQITLIPNENLIELFISEIKRSKVEIKNCVVLSDKFPIFNFEGTTYDLSINGCTFIPMLDEYNIPDQDDCYVKINKGDTVLRKRTDERGYAQSCGVENKNKDIVIIVRENNEN